MEMEEQRSNRLRSRSVEFFDRRKLELDGGHGRYATLERQKLADFPGWQEVSVKKRTWRQEAFESTVEGEIHMSFTRRPWPLDRQRRRERPRVTKLISKRG